MQQPDGAGTGCAWQQRGLLPIDGSLRLVMKLAVIAVVVLRRRRPLIPQAFVKLPRCALRKDRESLREFAFSMGFDANGHMPEATAGCWRPAVRATDAPGAQSRDGVRLLNHEIGRASLRDTAKGS